MMSSYQKQIDFNHLPESIKNVILSYLQRDNFVEAKHVYDKAVQNSNHHNNQDTKTSNNNHYYK